MNAPLNSAEFRTEIEDRFGALAIDLRSIFARLDKIDRGLRQIEQNQATIVGNQQALAKRIGQLQDIDDAELEAQRAQADTGLQRGN